MREYNGYTYDSVLDEYAIRVYSLVIEASKARALDHLRTIEANVLPQQSESVYNDTVEHYKVMAGLSEVEEEDPHAHEKLKKLFAQF